MFIILMNLKFNKAIIQSAAKGYWVRSNMEVNMER